jgi:hypothetical protein
LNITVLRVLKGEDRGLRGLVVGTGRGRASLGRRSWWLEHSGKEFQRFLVNYSFDGEYLSANLNGNILLD